ncbi:MAG: mechanosensitive ion channel [Candidatus Aminicenantes bacterium]|nr:mechanosensitive ion channel [Candidatus Aminicenantes bacterium]
MVLFFPLLLTVLGFGGLLWSVHRILIGRHSNLGNERMFSRQLAMLGLIFVGIVAITLALPVSDSSRNQVIWIIGLVISGIFAFSSSTIFANLMAGILLRITKPFRIGDFVYVRDYFGRVAERGLFDTEIQSENRELIAIPNTYLISNPVSTVPGSGAIVSASLSLGYDVHHAKVEPLLLKAAEKSGLEEPFVHILELGNYAITYRVSGVLSEVKGLITARSNLYRAVLDVLHGHGIEITSPAYMNQRRLAEDQSCIPEPVMEKQGEKAPAAEEIVFDKAELAQQKEDTKNDLLENIKQLEKELKEEANPDKDKIKKTLEKARERLKAFDEKAAE